MVVVFGLVLIHFGILLQGTKKTCSYLARLKCLYLSEVFVLFLCMAKACWTNIFEKISAKKLIYPVIEIVYSWLLW